MSACALYLRSSKDRHDVSIDAQRRALLELAGRHRLEVVAEYSDAVEAANDWARPGFSRMLVEVENRARGWDRLLVFDTSRLARDINKARAFRQICERRGVKVLYEKIPDADPLSELVMGVVFELLDHIHSMLSREKGLAGMAENVRKGFRAGGRAPYGYELKAIEVGAVRDGAPVTKTRLDPNADAPGISAYLKARAQGLPSRQAARDAGLRLSMSSLVDVEWRALTYAGHTVWNQMATRGVGAGGHQGGAKRRPRADWMIQRGTHPALITDAEAEAVLAHRLNLKATRVRGDAYLLSGILVAPGGRRWHGDAGFYRCGGRRLSAANLERQVLAQIGRELLSEGIVKQALQNLHAAGRPSGRNDTRATALQREAAEIERKIGRVRNLMTTMRNPGAMAPKLEELVDQKAAIDREAASLVDEASAKKVHRLYTEADVRRAIAGMVDGLPGLERAQQKARLQTLLHQVAINPDDLSCWLHYRIPGQTGYSVASPRRAGGKPAMGIVRKLRLYRFRRAA